MEKRDREILEYLLERTSLETFNYAIRNYDLQRIYYARMNVIKAKFFDNNLLRASVEMRRIFDRFQTQKQEAEARKIDLEMQQIRMKMRRRGKRNGGRTLMVKEYNELVDRLNQLNSGVGELRRMYMEITMPTTRKS